MFVRVWHAGVTGNNPHGRETVCMCVRVCVHCVSVLCAV